MTILEFSAEPCKNIADYLAKHYQYGKVGIITDGCDDGLIKALKDNKNTIQTYSHAYNEQVPENIQYFVAQGGKDTINAGKRLAQNAKLLIIPEGGFRSCFSTIYIDGYTICQTKVPHLVVVDNTGICQRDIIIAIMSVLTDVIDISLGMAGKQDLLLKLRNCLLDTLHNRMDKEKAIRIIMLASRAVDLSGFLGIVPVVDAVNRLNIKTMQNYQDFDFFTYYLINLILLQFTKMQLNGIVIGSDRVKARKALKCLGESYRESFIHAIQFDSCSDNFVLSRSDLNAVALRYGRASKSWRYPAETLENAISNLQIAYEIMDTDGIFTPLIGGGYIDKMIKKD